MKLSAPRKQSSSATVMQSVYDVMRVFFPSRSTPVSTLYLNLSAFVCFAVLLLSKLHSVELHDSLRSGLSWIVVFLPLFITNVVSLVSLLRNLPSRRHFHQDKQSQQQRWSTCITLIANVRFLLRDIDEDGDRARLIDGSADYRQIESTALTPFERKRNIANSFCLLLNVICSIYCKVFVVYCLETQYAHPRTVLVLTPCWLLAMTSFALRACSSFLWNVSTASETSDEVDLMDQDEIHDEEEEHAAHQQLRARRAHADTQYIRLASIVMLSLFFSLRILQPFLIALRVQSSVQSSWMEILLPLWMWMFFALAVALLLIAMLSYTNVLSSCEQVQQSSRRLAVMLAIQLGVHAGLLGWAIVATGRSLDSDGDVISAEVTTVGKALVISALWIMLSVPFVNKANLLFQNALAKRTVDLIMFSNTTGIETVKKVEWLVQSSGSTFVITDQKSITNESELKSGVDLSQLSSKMISTTHQVVSWLANGTSARLPLPKPSLDDQKDIEMSTMTSSPAVEAVPYNAQDKLPKSEEEPTASVRVDVRANGQVIEDSDGSAASSPLCVVCLMKPADCVIQDCGHLCCCIYCALSVARQSRGQCPLCRTKLSVLLRLKEAPFQLEDGKTVAISNVTYYAPSAMGYGVAQPQSKSAVEQRLIAATQTRLHDHESIYEVFG